MRISRNWLQRYFAHELASAESIADDLLLHSFEIEGIEHTGTDSVIDIDVLPNRAHDCLSHIGIAHEYAMLNRYEMNLSLYHYHDTYQVNEEDSISVEVENTKQCLRYLARGVYGVRVTASPDWLKESLSAIGQQSINNLVDATNFVMFDLGQPIHIFDADKVEGGIVVRNAYPGETMTLLGGQTVELIPEDLIIADHAGALALAGIKGGTKAEVSKDTKNIIIEVANFDPTSTRTTARRLKLFTDASKRFENGISSEIAGQAMDALSMLISDLVRGETFGAITDVYPKPEEQTIVQLDHGRVRSLLGVDISMDEIRDIFDRMNLSYHSDKETFAVHIPFERLDLRSQEDLIEEIGRIYGYHNIPVKSLDDYQFDPQVHKLSYLENHIKNLLVSQGYVEIKTYTFVKKGEREVFNPIASDKKALRASIAAQLHEALEKNHHFADFFGNDRTCIFEIGRVYKKDTEYTELCIGVLNKDKGARKKYGTEREQLETLVSFLSSELGIDLAAAYTDTSVRIQLDDLVDAINVDDYENVFALKSYADADIYHPISVYPYSMRDVSFWVSDEQGKEARYEELIWSVDTQYLKKVLLFDTFEKENRVSYAFSLVFQSDEKTLSDEDINTDMNAIVKTLEHVGAEIR